MVLGPLIAMGYARLRTSEVCVVRLRCWVVARGCMLFFATESLYGPGTLNCGGVCRDCEWVLCLIVQAVRGLFFAARGVSGGVRVW